MGRTFRQIAKDVRANSRDLANEVRRPFESLCTCHGDRSKPCGATRHG